MEKRFAVNRKFNYLTIISKTSNSRYWKFFCDCGKIHIARWDHVVYGFTRSCGCYRKINPSRKRHGLAGSRFYKIWSEMKRRCNKKNHHKYHRYGGRGIKVCAKWVVFDNFMDDMYEKYLIHSAKYGEKNTTIDRTNNDSNYCYENTEWRTWEEQSANRGMLYEYSGNRKNVTQLSKELKINRKTLTRRLNKGLSVEQALLIPFKQQYARN